MQRVPARRRFLKTGLAASATLLSAPWLGAQSRPELPHLSIAVAGKGSFGHMPLMLAEQLDFFRAENLDVEITDHGVWSVAQKALLAGNADLCAGAFTHVAAPAARAQGCQSIVLQGRTPQLAFGVSTRAMPNYHGLDDLRGRRIGISAPGATDHLMVHRVMTNAGIASGEVSFIAVGHAAAAVAALRAGQVDALSGAEPVMTLLEQKGELKVVADSRTLKHSADIFGGPMPAACLYAGRAFIAGHPRTCQGVANALVHALKWLQTAGPRDIIRTVPEAYLQGDRALYLAALTNLRETFSPDGMLSADGARTALKVMADFEANPDPKAVSATGLYTNEFARQAKERYQV